MNTADFCTRWFRDLRIDQVAPYVRGEVLDLACGPGLVLEKCEKQIDSYTGVDLDEDHLNRLARMYPEHTFKPMNLDAPLFDFSHQFDTVVMLASIGLLGNQLLLLDAIRDSLKPGGRLVLTTPTPFGDFILDWGTRFGLFAQSGDQDKQIVVYNNRRSQLIANRSGLVLEEWRMFELFCNQLAVLRKD